uniref:CHK domain-containing protein n=1 Tax=Steinernema glaseri TaxID=37863 RepID=A0A1I8AEH8_9BILA
MRRTKTQPHVTPIAQRCSPRTSNSPPPSAARTLMEPRRIGSTSYDLAFLIDILNEHDELYPKFIKIENVAEKLVSENRGFGSNIYSVRLTSGEGEEYSFVCKIPTVEYLNKYLHEANEESKKFSEKELEEQEEINLTQVRETHNREVDFYRFAKENIPKSVKIPRFIYGEYMTEENEPVDSLIKCLKAFITLSAHDLLENEDYTWFTPELAEKTIALSEYDKLMKVMASRPELGMPPVICQGDLWPSNVLWEHKSDGMRHLLSIIDWQDCYIGSYANDLASLLAINMDAETRKSCEQDVLRYYVEKMNEYKKSFNLDIDLTYDKAWIAYKKAIQVAILITMTIVENPEDVVENGENMGRITKRLVHMLEDAEFE